MTNRLMISVAAAALIAGTGFANAQGVGRESGSGSTMQQQSAPAAEHGNSAAPANRDALEPSSGQPSGMKSTQSEEKSPAAGKNQRAQGNMGDQKSKSMSSENDSAKENAKENTKENTKGGAKDMKAQGAEDRNTAQGREDRDTAQGREDRSGTMNAESKGADSKSQTTVGQAGAGAKLSTEQRTRITTVIRDQHVAPVEHVNFSISVGTRVPHDVRFYPLPTEVVTIYPEWRGYEFILVGDQIVVVDPRTFEIVAVIEA
jgi:hypothetical protein